MTRRPGGTLRARAGALVALALVLAGCSSGSDPASVGSTPSTAAPTSAPGSPGTAPLAGPQGFPTTILLVTRPDGTVEEWCVWLADTTELRRRGLMGVTDPDLGGLAAMVFRYDADSTSGFWMRDTLLPLSIAWYDADGRLVSSTDMEPCPAGSVDCPRYPPGGTYRVAVEVPRGGLDELGLVEGATIALGGACAAPAASEA